MRTAELLNAMANWLESPNNEAMLLAEADEKCMSVVAESCVLAAALLKKAADEVDAMEPPAESLITPESISETAALASALDESGDPELKKMASVLDELLLTIAAPPNALAQRKEAEYNRIEELKKKYEDPRKVLRDVNKIGVTEKAIEKSNFTKEYKLNRHPLQTRTCPRHPGALMYRISEGVFVCEIDKKAYDYTNGYTLDNGEKVPGGSVDLQTANVVTPFTALFSNESRRGYHQ